MQRARGWCGIRPSLVLPADISRDDDRSTVPLTSADAHNVWRHWPASPKPRGAPPRDRRRRAERRQGTRHLESVAAAALVSQCARRCLARRTGHLPADDERNLAFTRNRTRGRLGSSSARAYADRPRSWRMRASRSAAAQLSGRADHRLLLPSHAVASSSSPRTSASTGSLARKLQARGVGTFPGPVLSGAPPKDRPGRASPA